MRLPGPTPHEGKVAADILARKDIPEATDMRPVAEESDLTNAMVVKDAQKLGFAGFCAFRQGLFDCSNSDSTALHAEISVDDKADQMAQKVFRTAADLNQSRTLRAAQSKRKV